MEENGRDFDIVKIQKTGSKTGQNRFWIFPFTFLNSLGQDGPNALCRELPLFTLDWLFASIERICITAHFELHTVHRVLILQQNMFGNIL